MERRGEMERWRDREGEKKEKRRRREIRRLSSTTRSSSFRLSFLFLILFQFAAAIGLLLLLRSVAGVPRLRLVFPAFASHCRTFTGQMSEKKQEKQQQQQQQQEDEKQKEQHLGMKEVREGKAVLQFPDTNEVFYNPVQVFNRDLSVNVIRTFLHFLSLERAEKAAAAAAAATTAQRNRGKTQQGKDTQPNDEDEEQDAGTRGHPATSSSSLSSSAAAATSVTAADSPIDLLEALSATGLRAIRYHKEIPGLSSIIANDVSPSAVVNIRRNVEYNGLDPTTQVIPNQGDARFPTPPRSHIDIPPVHSS